jgi:undecaprenyl pyrophosphate synthase
MKILPCSLHSRHELKLRREGRLEHSALIMAGNSRCAASLSTALSMVYNDISLLLTHRNKMTSLKGVTSQCWELLSTCLRPWQSRTGFGGGHAHYGVHTEQVSHPERRGTDFVQGMAWGEAIGSLLSYFWLCHTCQAGNKHLAS